MKIFEKANAKINLYLDVSERREDGYHDVVTLMHQVSLCDKIYIEACDSDCMQITLQIVGGKDDIPNDRRNLVYRAAELFLATLERPMRVSIVLHKSIPSMAGLGGGSSDAAATLRGLNRMLDSPFSVIELEYLAAQLGSDTPFFINSIAALCLGRGEIVQKIPLEFSGHVVIIEGIEPSSTKEAFSQLDKRRAPSFRPLPDFKHFSFADVHNVFEGVISEQCPSVALHLDIVRQYAPLCSAMSGSGSAVFAIFEKEKQARYVAEKIAEIGSRAYVSQLVTSI